MPAAMSRTPPIRSGSCAEAGAIAAMVQAGERRITEILVLGGGERPCTPCGGCRQRLAEFAGPETPVHVVGPEGPRLETRLGDLLPHGFTLSAPPTRSPADDRPETSP